MRWYAGSDHAGFELKKQLIASLEALGDEVSDLGCDSLESVDYPDFAGKVARVVAEQGDSRGLLVCGTGNGIAMAANKVAGVRCAVVTETFTAHMARAHNDANIIAIGSRVIGAGVAELALRAFRDTDFEGGRHERRVDKIDALGGV